jgi:hypothetical protein
MSARPLLATLLLLAAGCGAEEAAEVRLLAPVGVVEDAEAERFESETGCRVDLRVYDADENLDEIAERRDTDVIAGPPPEGEPAHVVEDLVRATLRGGVVVTVPRRLATALDPLETRPAGRRRLAWAIRDEGDNDECARRWLAYATSQ